MKDLPSLSIAAIIGLGNPGSRFVNNRHNIGFRVVEELAQRHNAAWRTRDNMELAEVFINEKKVLLIKPQTFMNSSGAVIPFLSKQGAKAENIMVVHDELEVPFGKIKVRVGGSARGHNGLRSIIQHCGAEFARLRFGISRPEQREMVGDYVLQNFSEDPAEIENLISQAADMIEEVLESQSP